MNSSQNPTRAYTLIAIDEDLVMALQVTLEAARLELSKGQQGKEPMTLKAAAAYLHVSYPTLKDYIAKGQIVTSQYGNRIWIIRSELDAFVARHRFKFRR